LRAQGEYGKIVRMKTVLVFSTSTGNANTEMMEGVRKFTGHNPLEWRRLSR